MLKRYFKTGEFAELCGVKKHTLFHYDEIGLLCPEIRGENEYRYYSMEQIETYHIINVLKTVGMPLKEIKAYLKEQDKGTFLQLLKSKIEYLNKEADKIKNMQLYLSDTITSSEEGMNIATGIIEIINCDEEYMIATKVQEDIEDIEQQNFQAINEHIQYCMFKDLPVNLHIGEIVSFENMKNNIFRESYYTSHLPAKLEDERMIIKPKGLYAITYHKGNYESLYDAFRDMKEKIEEMGYVPSGNLYEEDMIDIFFEKDENCFIMKIAMLVEKIK